MDHLEHLAAYYVWMEFEAAEDAVMCLAFLLTLEGVARAWFISLRLGTIGSFKQLEDASVRLISPSLIWRPFPSLARSLVHAIEESTY